FVALQQGQNAFQYSTGRVEVQQTARMAVDRMVHDLRTGSTVTASTATSVSFQYIDDTGATVTVQYSLNGTDLQRNQTNPVPAAAQPETLIGGVNALALTYYDSSNGATLTALTVAFLAFSSSEPAIAMNHMNNAQARAIAESGIERALWALSKGESIPGAANSIADPLPAPVPAPYDGSQYVAMGVGGFIV